MKSLHNNKVTARGKKRGISKGNQKGTVVFRLFQVSKQHWSPKKGDPSNFFGTSKQRLLWYLPSDRIRISIVNLHANFSTRFLVWDMSADKQGKNNKISCHALASEVQQTSRDSINYVQVQKKSCSLMKCSICWLYMVLSGKRAARRIQFQCFFLSLRASNT